MNNAELLARYKAMHNLSQQMLESARQNDWDRLVELSNARTAIVEELAPQDKLPWKGAEAIQKKELIRAVLATDEEVKALTKSWMEKIQETLGSIAVEKKLKKAYESP